MFAVLCLYVLLLLLLPFFGVINDDDDDDDRAVMIHPPARLVGEPKKTKKERKEERHLNRGKLAIRPDHPRRWIKIKLCMHLRCVVIHVKCDPKRIRGYGAVGGVHVFCFASFVCTF